MASLTSNDRSSCRWYGIKIVGDIAKSGPYTIERTGKMVKLSKEGKTVKRSYSISELTFALSNLRAKEWYIWQRSYDHRDIYPD